MPSPKNRKTSVNKTTESLGKKILRELIGILFLAVAVFILVSAASFDPADPSFNQYFVSTEKMEVKNHAGIVGAYVADSLVQVSGSTVFLVAGFIIMAGWGFIRAKSLRYFIRYFIVTLLLVVSVGTLLGLYFPEDPLFGKTIKPGGITGYFFSSLLVKYLNQVGSYILVVTLLAVAVLAATKLSINSAVEMIKKGVLFLFRVVKHFLLATKELLWDIFSTGSERLGDAIAEKRELWKEKAAERARLKEEEAVMGETEPADSPDKQPIEDFVDTEFAPKIVRGVTESAGKNKRKSEKKKDFQEPFPFLAKVKRYTIPPVSLLEKPPPKTDIQKKNEEELLTNAKILEKKLEAFGIQGKVVQVLPGPVITMYEYEPATGIKVSKIMNLSDDLALSMRAASVRILAPVPGKAVVGIEIPNLHRETVYLREVLSSDLYQNTKSRLTIAVGNDASGQPVVADLSQIPHLLIAGSTGSGKSVGVNGMICSILLKAKPEEVKFIMIDPKMLELSIYDGIPHLISPVVTDPKKAASALKWVVEEMEKRYQLLSEHGVRNVGGFNRLVKDKKKKKAEMEEEEDSEELLFRSLGERDENLKDQFSEFDEEPSEEKVVEPPTEKLPYIVVVIDELADLMMTSPKDVEFSIARIAQMARAAGIHMIVATQRPSVDVLTGLIKANFPARIAYKVTSRVDSRTILDNMGAEKLLGKGDLLFSPPGTSKQERIHGCWVSDFEVKRIVEFLKKQQKPHYIKDILKERMEKDAEVNEDDEFDPLYDQAVALVTSTGMASISMVQRKMRIGYNRAARMIEKMEKEGVVGPSDGVKQREVYARGI